MVAVTLMVEKEFEIAYLDVVVRPRYWEDGMFRQPGKLVEDDNDNPQMPCVEGDTWHIEIDVNEGYITNWKQGVEAYVYYKVCDDGVYKILDEDLNVVAYYEDIYVPPVLYPGANGYGDYVTLKIDKNGYIDAWNTEDFVEWVDAMQREDY